MNFPMLAGLETFAINIIVALICLERRFSLVVMLLASLVLGLCSALIMPELTRFDPEHSLGLVYTIAFLLPSIFLYRDQLRKKVLVFATVWIFTFAVESTADLVPRLLFGNGMPLEWLQPVIQLALLLVTTPFVIKFIRCEFALLMSRLSRKYFNILVSCTVLWLGMLYLARLLLMRGRPDTGSIVFFMILSAAIFLAYPLLVMLAEDAHEVSWLERAAKYDLLTGCFSRGQLYKDCDKMFGDDLSFALIFMDLDDFKLVNDSLGHQAGDIYLKVFAGTVQNLIMPQGQLYRYSGDEFVILCPKKDATAIMHRISSHPWHEFKTAKVGEFSGVSLGCSICGQDGCSLDDMILNADFRMYEEKRQAKCI